MQCVNNLLIQLRCFTSEHKYNELNSTLDEIKPKLEPMEQTGNAFI